MKKIAIFGLALLMALTFAGCRGNTEPEPTEPPVTTAPATDPAPTIIPTVPDVIEPNVPDPSVDDGTLEDMIPDGTDGAQEDGGMNSRIRRLK